MVNYCCRKNYRTFATGLNKQTCILLATQVHTEPFPLTEVTRKGKQGTGGGGGPPADASCTSEDQNGLDGRGPVS
jgi:hypothetical protein